MSEPAFEELEGTVVGERYRLIRKIGEGGMATVWEAEHMTLGSQVAVKFLRHGAVQSAQTRERFLREARVSASVRHRNVVEIQDFGVTPQGAPYLVMEYLRGESFASMLDSRGPLPPAEAVRIVGLILRGLIAVHEQGIIHRDLKPENVFIVDDPDGRYPKLLDFGVCRAAVAEPGGKNLTREGMILGTLQYMSAEQARGAKDVDQRTDVYAAGVMLYEALAGRLPFEAKGKGDLLVKIVCEEPTPVRDHAPGLPESLAAVVMKALARDRDARYQTARELRDALFGASRANGFMNVESGVVHRVDILERIARAEAETVLDEAPRAAAALPPEPAQRRSQIGLVVILLLLAGAAAAVMAL